MWPGVRTLALIGDKITSPTSVPLVPTLLCLQCPVSLSAPTRTRPRYGCSLCGSSAYLNRWHIALADFSRHGFKQHSLAISAHGLDAGNPVTALKNGDGTLYRSICQTTFIALTQSVLGKATVKAPARGTLEVGGALSNPKMKNNA